MHSSSHATARLHFISLLLAYALIISLLAPFAVKRAQASAVTMRDGEENGPASDSANRELLPPTPVSGKHRGDLLGRFLGGVSEHDKATAVIPGLNRIPWATHEGLIKRQLSLEPGFQKLGIASTQDIAMVGQQSRLNPAVGAPTPSPFPTPGYGSGGTGPGGSFNTTPPPVTTGAPGPKLPNLDDIRNAESEEPRASQRFQPNLMCADCDPQGGGGGGGLLSTERSQLLGPARTSSQ